MLNNYEELKKEYGGKICKRIPDVPNITELKKIESEYKYITNDIKSVKEYLETLENTLKDLATRYNELIAYQNTAKVEITLKRQHFSCDKKVWYFLTKTIHYEDGTYHIEHLERYAGKERKEAFDTFKQMQKEHRNWTFTQDTEKSYWELSPEEREKRRAAQ